jgi:hypothetical protein
MGYTFQMIGLGSLDAAFSVQTQNVLPQSVKQTKLVVQTKPVVVQAKPGVVQQVKQAVQKLVSVVQKPTKLVSPVKPKVLRPTTVQLKKKPQKFSAKPSTWHIPPKPKPFMTVPAQRAPVGISVWWRPVAVGFPNTGTSASYVGPQPSTPQWFKGSAHPALIHEYFQSSRRIAGPQMYMEMSTPSMSACRSAQPRIVNGRVVLARRADPAQPSGNQVITTAAGLMRLPQGVWYNPMSPALMVG